MLPFCISFPMDSFSLSLESVSLPQKSAFSQTIPMPVVTLHHSLYIVTGAWLDLGHLLVLADSWLVCLPSWVGSLLSVSSVLVEGTGLELSRL